MRLPLAVAVLCAGFALPATAQAPADAAKLKRGEYLVTIMDCTGCHTPGKLLGKPDHGRLLAGSEVGFGIPGLGTFYPPNLTPDRETGLGGWSEADIVKAVRTGVRPDGRVLAPIMPYDNYGRLTDADAAALATYLKSLKPVRNAAPRLVGPTEKPTAPYLSVVMP
ncbi:cytochrome C [Bosea sp. Root381]|uniref:c-type cytochrome n=1 Tax=Bosea sp. Root381 TaxID=1736524 RepID=UPI0006F3A5EC|nr:c-type cytochrome [Bosea sp. Root381]KRE00277.1 cytochrome C [Bosea sp. Root381]